jgi:Holliday junction resolvase RusA-like endonuclease
MEVIYGTVPSKSNSYRFSGKFMYKTKALKDYEQSFIEQCTFYKGAKIQGNIKIILKVYYPNRKSDLDGVTKAVLDLLQKVEAFDNDNKVAELFLYKGLDKENPRIEFLIEPVDYII